MATPEPSGSIVWPKPWTLGSCGMPQIVHVVGMIQHSLAELAVDVLGDGGQGRGIGLAPGLVEQVVDDGIVAGGRS